MEYIRLNLKRCLFWRFVSFSLEWILLFSGHVVHHYFSFLRLEFSIFAAQIYILLFNKNISLFRKLCKWLYLHYIPSVYYRSYEFTSRLILYICMMWLPWSNLYHLIFTHLKLCFITVIHNFQVGVITMVFEGRIKRLQIDMIRT